MLRPMTARVHGSLVRFLSLASVEERKRRGPERRRTSANQTEPRYKRNEQREKKKKKKKRKVKHEGGKVQLSPSGVASLLCHRRSARFVCAFTSGRVNTADTLIRGILGNEFGRVYRFNSALSARKFAFLSFSLSLSLSLFLSGFSSKWSGFSPMAPTCCTLATCNRSN